MGTLKLGAFGRKVRPEKTKLDKKLSGAFSGIMDKNFWTNMMPKYKVEVKVCVKNEV